MEILSTSLKSWSVIIFKSYDEYFQVQSFQDYNYAFYQNKIYKIPSIVPMAMTNSRNFIITQPFKSLWVVQDLGQVPNYNVSNHENLQTIDCVKFHFVTKASTQSLYNQKGNMN